MEFPFGHHHRRDDEEELYPPPPSFDRPRPPPPAYYGVNEPPPPPPQVTHVYHASHVGGGEPYPPPSSHHHQTPYYYDASPPPHSQNFGYSDSPGYRLPPSQNFGYSDSPGFRPPPAEYSSSVTHVSHESEPHHHHHPHMPSFLHHHSHHSQGFEFNNRPTVRIFCKAETNYSLTIRDGKVVLARADPSDPRQHWIKDEKYSTKVKDEEGFPSFSLVNKVTGEAIKHSIGATHPVQLIPYNPDRLDESVLWTLSRDTGEDYRAIRMVNNIRLNVDAFNGDKDHGGVRDGTTIVLWEWTKGENQRWKVIPY